MRCCCQCSGSLCKHIIICIDSRAIFSSNFMCLFIGWGRFWTLQKPSLATLGCSKSPVWLLLTTLLAPSLHSASYLLYFYQLHNTFWVLYIALLAHLARLGHHKTLKNTVWPNMSTLGSSWMLQKQSLVDIYCAYSTHIAFWLLLHGTESPVEETSTVVSYNP